MKTGFEQQVEIIIEVLCRDGLKEMAHSVRRIHDKLEQALFILGDREDLKGSEE